MSSNDIKHNQFVVNKYPSLIKYMGSKSKIMDFVFEGINKTYQGGVICDLFSGSGSLAGAIKQQCPVISNDIQSYSGILAKTYNQAYKYLHAPTADHLLSKAEDIYKKNNKSLNLHIEFPKNISLDDFNNQEEKQKELISRKFKRDWHLFLKNYSGTWWSSDQCLWIDAIRQIAEDYSDDPIYPAILSSLMFSMAYASQGTGHYAQYRDAKTESSMEDILIYRRRDIPSYFQRKYCEILNWIPSEKPSYKHNSTALDYSECLESLRGGLVYADPPYCFVHYSRFYHALETLVLYDYPELQIRAGKIVKGRYRENRHQSPFSIKSQVEKSFRTLFIGVKKARSNLVLSYSNTGMISLDLLEKLALEILENYKIEILTTDHKHMTLGRQNDRHRDVKECLLMAKRLK